ncbi:MAG TPA: ribosome rescue protein RqcH [Nitrososphaera sp.]|jgi:predicted ribosome quality control (RQC) complex YloA/Tae2 family protein|nr:ribosome rescue protein RqcH [Nitrososphaera sp.]
MELSGIELRYLVNEIASRATGGYYVSGVNAITKSSLLLRMHHPVQEDIMLVLSTRGMWITKLKFKPVEENNIEAYAQAHLERCKLESAEQAGSERIVSLKFRRPADGTAKVVVCEFFGEGNIVICDEAMQILAILNPIEVRHRTLKVGLRYAYPPTRGLDVFQITLEQLVALRNEAAKIDALRWIGRGISMPKKFVEEVAKRAGIDSAKQASQLSDEEVGKIYSTIKSMVGDVSTGRNHQPIIIMQASKPVEALPLVTSEAEKLEVKRVGSYMDAVDEVLSAEILDVGRSSRTIELDRQIAVLEHDLEEQNKAKEAVMQKSAAIRKLAGDLMALSYQGTEEPELDAVMSQNSAAIVKDKGVSYIEVSGERVEMQQNLAKASSMLFRRAKEMERGNASIEEARAKLVAQIEKLRSQTAAIHKKVVVKEQTSKEWFERYRWFVTSDGLLAIGGRDASSNSALIRKHLTEHDIVFHAEVHGSPFFIIKNSAGAALDGQIENSLSQVAQATVAFSRAWKDGLSSADAYWVLPEQIKKGAPTGQFLPKGSFVIEGKRNYLKGVEIRLAIGVAQMGGKETLVCGPEDAIKKHSLFYAVLQQGGMDPMTAAKKVKSEMVKAAGEGDMAESLKRISLDDFVRTLPTGQSRISFTAKGQHENELIPPAEGPHAK